MSVARILLTGARGFVGSQVLSCLPEGSEINCVSRTPPEGETSEIVWHNADLLDPSACEALILQVKPTHLIHLAWTTEHGVFWSSPENERWLTAGTVLLRAFGRAGGRRALIAGTCAEYSHRAPSPVQEDAPGIEPETIYGLSKNTLCRTAMLISGKYGFSLAWPRIFIPYGIGEKPGRLTPSTIRSLQMGMPAKCSSGRQIRDFMDVRDLGAAIALLVFSDVTGPINLGSGQPTSIAEFANTIGTLMGRPELIALGAHQDRLGEPEIQIPKLDRMRDELGFFPKISLQQGLADAIAWWSTTRGSNA